MSSGQSNPPSKKERRDAAREKARLMREEEKRRARRRRWIVQGSVGVGVLVVLAIIALVVVSSVRPAGSGPSNMASGGILFTSSTKVVRTPALAPGEKTTPTKQNLSDSKAHITVYIDYQCPFCQEFETANTPQISGWLDAGTATYEVHPVSILDSPRNHDYATRAGNAMICVANDKPDAYLAASNAMYKNQPPETATGLPDTKILSILKGAGVAGADVTDCVKNGRFSSWLTAQTTAAKSAKTLPNSSVAFSGTPTVLVNGKQYQGSLTDPAAFAQFVSQTVPGFKPGA
jgi:protein-disulfide isomerase